MTIVNPQMAAISTLGEICGETWEVNKAVDVTNCEDLGPNTGIYNIYRIDGNKLCVDDT